MSRNPNREHIIEEMVHDALTWSNEDIFRLSELEKLITAKVELVGPITDEEEKLIGIVCHLLYSEIMIKPRSKIK